MGGIKARNMLSWLELLINRYYFYLFGVYIIYVNDARSKNIKFTVSIFAITYMYLQQMNIMIINVSLAKQRFVLTHQNTVLQ